METVTRKYLRNEYPSIEAYNAEEQNRLEKFRPYGIAPEEWLKEVGEKLRKRPVPPNERP